MALKKMNITRCTVSKNSQTQAMIFLKNMDSKSKDLSPLGSMIGKEEADVLTFEFCSIYQKLSIFYIE